MPVKNEIKLTCDYCGVEGTITLQKYTPRWTEWFVLCPAESLGSLLQTAQHAYCRKCKLRIEEIGRISRYSAEQILHPPALDNLLPEDDLPDSVFTNGYPNPDFACIGSPGGYNSLPVEMRVKNPLWTKKPAVKRKKKGKE